MTNEKLYALMEERYQSLLAIERDYKAGLLGGRVSSEQNAQPAMSNRLVCLLEDINNSDHGKAMILSGVDQVHAFTISIVGFSNVSSDPTFSLSINGQTREVDARMSAAELAAVIYGMGFESGVTVRLGRSVIDGQTYYPWRYFIEFSQAVFPVRPTVRVNEFILDPDRFGIASLYRASLKTTRLRPTGTLLDVYTVIPNPLPSPLRAGSIAAVTHYWGVGWGITAVEPRMYDDVWVPPIDPTPWD